MVRKTKTFLFFFIGFAVCAGGILWHFLQKNDLLFFPITYTNGNLPTMNVKIGPNTYQLEIRIGSRFPLLLTEEVLAKLDKKPHGSTEHYRPQGDCDLSPSYLIPKVQIGDLTLTNVVAAQSETKDFNALGMYLGGTMNLFLDFPRSRIIACDSFSKLKNNGFVSDNWIQVPFEVGITGVILTVHTDLRAYNLSLNTNVEYNYLRSSQISDDPFFTSSTFRIGMRDFGKATFYPIDITSNVFHNIDGFIGMDFLENQAIYLDYTNKIAYIEPAPVYFERFSVSFGPCNMPIIDMYIEGEAYTIGIDLGNHSLVTLDQKILQKIHKTSYGTANWIDFKGNSYQSPTYVVPEIKMGNQTFTNSIVRQDSEEFHSNVSFKIDSSFYRKLSPASSLESLRVGMLGHPILKKCNLFLDFKHFAMYASHDHLSLQKQGLLSDHLLKIPFSPHPDGIMFFVETDLGSLKVILDTGATVTLVRAPYPTSTSKFSIMGHDFGPRRIFPADIAPEFDCDAILGMDFLNEYPFFIDYTNKLIYLDLQKNE